MRVIALRTPQRLRALARQGFKVSVDLESFYTDDMWRRAETSGWLEPIHDLAALLSAGLVSAMAAGGPNPFQALDAGDSLRLKNKFSSAGKRNAARRLTRLRAPDAERELAEFRPLITELVGHFNLGPVEQQAG